MFGDLRPASADASPSQPLTLAAQLRARYVHARATRSDRTNATMDRMIEDLARRGVGRGAPRAGSPAPDFDLPSASGANVRLSAVLAERHAVVCFYRGGWCPYCNIQLRAYQARLDEIERFGGSLIAISPQLPDATLTTLRKNELAFEVLSDVGNAVARAYGLAFRIPDDVVAFYRDEKHFDLADFNGDSSHELPIPATFVVATNGKIALADVDPDYTRRLEPDAVIAALRNLA
jgi:peroxiredoxin